MELNKTEDIAIVEPVVGSIASDIGLLIIPMEVNDEVIKIAQLMKRSAERELDVDEFTIYKPILYIKKSGTHYRIRVSQH